MAAKSVTQPLAVSPETKVLRLIKLSAVAKDSQGKPLTGVVGITLALYDEQEGGAPLWMETQNVEADAQGRYGVLLGATSSEGLPLELFAAGQARWLGVQVQGQEEEPRLLLVSVPYALMAAEAESLAGRSASEYVLAEELKAPGGAEKFGLAAVNAPQPAAAAGGGGGSVKGSGTANYLARWTASDTLANSIIFQTPDGKIGIGTTTPAEQLHIAGDVMADVFFGSGAGLTQLHPANLIPGTAGINITGNAASASFAANADLLDNLNSLQFARVDISNIFQADQTIPNLFVGNVTSTGLVSTSSLVASQGEFTGALNVPGVFSGSGAAFTGSVAGALVEATQNQPGTEVRDAAPTALRATATALSGWTVGVRGVAHSTRGRGLLGQATATSGETIGVLGLNASTEGTGVSGVASALTGAAIGVHGSARSAEGTAGLFTNTNPSGRTTGVSGSVHSSDDMATAVRGEAWATSGTTFAVWGINHSDNGWGVAGEFPGTSGGGIAVIGTTHSPDGTAGVFYNVAGGTILRGWTGDPNTEVFRLDSGGNVHASGTVTAASFTGDGSGLTNLPIIGGDITGVYSGTGLSGGGNSGDVTLGLDTAFADARYAQLDASNTFTGDITAANLFANNLTASGALSGASVVASTGSVDRLRVDSYLNVVGHLVSASAHFTGPSNVPDQATLMVEGGIWGTSNGAGVAGGAESFGAHGVWGGNGYGGVAINGVSFGGDTGDSIGVFGISNSPNGVGVRGHTTAPGTGTGVHGEALAETGETQGVVGIVNSPQGTAGVFRNYAGGTILRGLTTNEGGEVFRVEGSGDVVTATGDFLALAPGKGIILRSPDGSKCARLGLDNNGELSITPVTCP